MTITHPPPLVEGPCMQPMVCWRHWSYEQPQWLTSRSHQQTRRQSNGICNGSHHRGCMACKCHMPWQPLQNHPSGHLGGWATRHGWHRICWMNNIKELTCLPMPELLTRGSLQKSLEEDLCWLSFMPPPPPNTHTHTPLTQSIEGLNWLVLVFSLHGSITQSHNGNKRHVASERVWVSFSPTVNWQGLYSISSRRKYGRVIHPQSTDRVYTAFHLLESIGELLTHSQQIWVVHISA